MANGTNVKSTESSDKSIKKFLQLHSLGPKIQEAGNKKWGIGCKVLDKAGYFPL